MSTSRQEAVFFRGFPVEVMTPKVAAVQGSVAVASSRAVCGMAVRGVHSMNPELTARTTRQ